MTPAKKVSIFSVFFILSSLFVLGQSASNDIDPDLQHCFDRLRLISGNQSETFHAEIKPYLRNDLKNLLDSVAVTTMSAIDRSNVAYYYGDNWELLDSSNRHDMINSKPFLKYLYRYKSDLVSYEDDNFDVHFSPVLNFNYGNTSGSRSLYVNTRGFEVRGRINKKIGFYTTMSDNIVRLPFYYLDTYVLPAQAVPYISRFKIPRDDTLRTQYNYLTARGYFNFKIFENLFFSFGHDKAFIGSGIRSLILSDFSPPYLQLKLNLRVRKFQYLYFLGQLTDVQSVERTTDREAFPPKYFAFHYLNYNFSPKLNIGLFESIMFGKRNGGVDLNYLNPILFYRFIESHLGSADNALIGLTFNYDFLRRFSAYGQFVLDEFNKDKFELDGWWAKKYGLQLGLKYFDVGSIKGLDAQYEYNIARPYLYSHFTSATNFSNYNLPLTHPLGANFKEQILKIRYQYRARLTAEFFYMFAQKGEDLGKLNYGGNVLKLNDHFRVSDYGNTIVQGFRNTIQHFRLNLDYRLAHRLYLYGYGYLRRDLLYNLGKSETGFGLGLRLNFVNPIALF